MKIESLDQRGIMKFALEQSFAFYCKKFLSVVEPETQFEWNWHIDVLCQSLQDQLDKKIWQNVDYNMPPRTLKSVIINVLFPTWAWARSPSFKIGSASSNYNLAVGFNMKRKELIESTQYQFYWPFKLKDAQSAKSWFENEFNGVMRSFSANGRITGVGFDILLTDDLLDVKDAFSKVKREAVNNWYSNAFYNRVQDKRSAIRINVNQRLHQKDLSGHLKENHNFERLVLEMIKSDKKLSTIEYKDPRKVGDYLFPLRYGPKEAEDDKKSLGVYGWSSQMQQDPLPIGGGIIKEEWLRYYDSLPSFSKTIITADLNMKEGGDYACFQAWGVTSTNEKYLIDIVRGKWSYKTTKEMFKEFCSKHPNILYKWIEDKANGPALISDLADIKVIKAWPEKPDYKKLGKVERLHMVSPSFESGQVYLPKNIELVKEFELELLSFTELGSTTGNDDMVDTCTMALMELKQANTFFF